MRKYIFLFFLFSVNFVFAQGEIDEQATMALRNERTFSPYIATNGYGFNFTYARRLDGFRKRLYYGDFAVLKHWKEEKTINPTTTSSRRFVYGKLNAVFIFRGGLGTQKEIFSKKDKGSISVRYFYNYGPAVALMKPIYYEVRYEYATSPYYTYYYTVEEKFDIENSTHQAYGIDGRASFFKGFDEIKVSPGFSARFGFTFEYGKRDNNFQAIETGVTVEGYLRGIDILAKWDTQYVLYGFYVAYRFGKVIQAKSIRG